jgi:uncharacterized membrane protein YdbT with pleckstrin-like domain
MRGYLEPGERVRLESRPHTVALAWPLGRALLAAAIGAGFLLGSPRAGVWLAVVGALVVAAGAVRALFDVWRWDRTHVVLTDEKLFVVHGLAQRHAAAVRLARVGAIEVEQSVLGRMLGYGTIVAGNLEIPFVPDPRSVCRLAG